MRELHVRRTDPRIAQVVDVSLGALTEGAARLRIDRVALTANNVTYAAMGDGMLGYWDFFPAPDGYGKVPSWGFATVVDSNAKELDVGARFYGLFPVAESLDVLPTCVSPRGFTDGASHRAAKAPVYNQYLNVAHDPLYDAACEPEQTLFRPLYATGWWAADCVLLSEPRMVVVSSASSKTALATAHRLRQLGGVEVVALTSPAHAAYVHEVGLYDRVVPYDALGEIASNGAAMFLDFLGRKGIVDGVHRALGDSLVRSLVIGATDWSASATRTEHAHVPGPSPEFFFVPVYAARRIGAAPELAAAMQHDLRAFYDASRAFVTANEGHGAESILSSWARLVAGEVLPNEGLVRAFG